MATGKEIGAPIAFASQIAPTYIGGLSIYQRRLAEALMRRGFSGYSLCEFERHPDTHLQYEEFPWPLHRLEEAPLAGVIKTLLPRLAGRPLAQYLSNFLAARRLRFPKTPTPKAVHVTGTGWDFTGFAMERWAQHLGVPLTIWPAVHLGQWGDDKIDLDFYRRADMVFCQTRHEIEHLVKLGLPVEKTMLCGLPPFCSADGDGARLREKLELGQRPVVFFLGRRDKGKGFPAVIAAWKTVRESYPDAVLLLAGPKGPASAPELPADSFRDLGLVDEQEKADAYAACDIFCLPSAHESFGIVYVEAWSYGKPVICGPAPASRELVEDARTGLWADQSPVVLAEKITTLLDSPAQARQLGEAGKQVQLALYTEEAVVHRHLEAWKIATHPG